MAFEQGSDIDCAEFWDDNCKGYLIGKGDTIQEAVDNLKSKLDTSVFAFNIDRYLFLDFDGVLNTGRYAKLMACEGIDPFENEKPKEPFGFSIVRLTGGQPPVR